MTLRTVTGVFLTAQDAPNEDLVVTFRLSPNFYNEHGHRTTDVLTATADEDGAISIGLVVGARYVVKAANQREFAIIIPAGDGSVSLESLHASGDAAGAPTDAVQTAIQAALADYATDDDLADEADARAAAITAEALTRATTDTALSAAVAAEQTARQAADTTLQANIAAEAMTRATDDQAISSSLSFEAQFRSDADTALQDAIDAEATARATADALRITQAAADLRYLLLSDRRQLQTFAFAHGNSTNTVNPVNADQELATVPRHRYHADLRPYTHARLRIYVTAASGTNTAKIRQTVTNSLAGGDMADLITTGTLTAGSWNVTAWTPLPVNVETWLCPVLNGSGGSVGYTSFHLDLTSKP